MSVVRPTALLLTTAALFVTCVGDGFQQVAGDDAGGDSPPRDDGPSVGPRPSPLDARPQPPDLSGCTALKSSFGPITLGFAEAYSLFAGLAAGPEGVTAVWELVSYDQKELKLAVLQPSGTIAVEEIQLEDSATAPSPTVAAMPSGAFGVLSIGDGPQLIFRRVDSSGKEAKLAELASNPGGYISKPTLIAGPTGIAAGYTAHGADKKGRAWVALIDEDGKLVVPFGELGKAGEQSRDLALLPSGAGFLAAWSESRPGDCWAVVASKLDAKLEPIAPLERIVIADGGACYRHPTLGRIDSNSALVCFERHPEQGKAGISCRTLAADGTLGPEVRSAVPARDSRRPVVVAAGDRYAVLWTAMDTGVEEIWSRIHAASGEALGEPAMISEQGVRSFYPSAVWTGDGFLTTWYRYVPITVYFAAYRLDCVD